MSSEIPGMVDRTGTPNGVGLPGVGGYVGGQTRRTPRRRPVRAGNARPGRPPGVPARLARLASLLGRTLRPQKPGPKPQGGEEMISCPRNHLATTSAEGGDLPGRGRALPTGAPGPPQLRAITVCRLVIYAVYYPATLALSGRPAQPVS